MSAVTRLRWPEMKTLIDSKSMNVQFIELANFYIVKAFDGLSIFVLEAFVDKDGGSDQIDFEANYKPSANGPLDKLTFDNQDLNVTTELTSLDLSSGNVPVAATIVDGGDCPTLNGSKWRTEQSTTDVSLSTVSYTTLKSLSNGTLHSIVLDFNTDRVDVKLTIDGQEIFNVDLDDLEDNQTSGSSSAAQATGGAGIMYVKTGSKFCFNPPCGLKYSSLVISAQAEQNNKKLSGYLLHYSVD